jgi:hypothetical protein
LTCHGAEVISQFRQKLLQVVDNDDHPMSFSRFFSFPGQEPICITGEGDALKEGAIDLSQEFTGGPTLMGCLFKIEIALYVVLKS